MSTGLARSVQVRLVRHAKELGVDPNLVLTRYAVERFLYRLSKSPYAERFVLKGALLILAWLGETIRPTRDADLLGFGELSDESLVHLFRAVCDEDVLEDAMTYVAETVRVVPIRPEDAYGGRRATLLARLGPARLRVQVDVGIGDAVWPEPQWMDYPSMLDLPRPRLRSYEPETTIAEKFHAMVVLGQVNSRMRDFFDIDALARRRSFNSRRLAQALRATFDRRNTPLPTSVPFALTRGFAESRDKMTQWRAFQRRIRVDPASDDLVQVVERIAAFLGPVLEVAQTSSTEQFTWHAGGPWSPGG